MHGAFNFGCYPLFFLKKENTTRRVHLLLAYETVFFSKAYETVVRVKFAGLAGACQKNGIFAFCKAPLAIL